MRTARLGRTGFLVSRVGFGGIPIQRLTGDEVVRVVRRPDLDIAFLGTANAHTTSEERWPSHLPIRAMLQESVAFCHRMEMEAEWVDEQ